VVEERVRKEHASTSRHSRLRRLSPSTENDQNGESVDERCRVTVPAKTSMRTHVHPHTHASNACTHAPVHAHERAHGVCAIELLTEHAWFQRARRHVRICVRARMHSEEHRARDAEDKEEALLVCLSRIEVRVADCEAEVQAESNLSHFAQLSHATRPSHTK